MASPGMCILKHCDLVAPPVKGLAEFQVGDALQSLCCHLPVVPGEVHSLQPPIKSSSLSTEEQRMSVALYFATVHALKQPVYQSMYVRVFWL